MHDFIYSNTVFFKDEQDQLFFRIIAITTHNIAAGRAKDWWCTETFVFEGLRLSIKYIFEFSSKLLLYLHQLQHTSYIL